MSGGHLISNYRYAIAQTKNENLLITGDKGVTFFNPQLETSRFIKLGVSLPITSITEGCGVTICNDGEIFVGGSDGLTSFKESKLYLERKEHSLYFSGISIHNRQLFPGDDTDVLSQALPFTDKIHLAYNQNNIVVNFASTNYIDIQRNNEYEHMLEGFDNSWNPTTHYSIYTNLNSGTYRLILRERAALLDTPRTQETSLFIHIARPWYNTVWTWMTYIAVFASAFTFIIHTHNSRRNLALSLEKKQQEKEHNEKLTQTKLHFFTNISHEFRVPLTLIIGQIDLLSQSSSLSPSVHNKILNISRNANRMRGVINELLEFH